LRLQEIQNRIHELRDQKVMLDFDLAKMYQVETRVLKQAVRRNSEFENLRSQFVTSKHGGIHNNIIKIKRKRFLPSQE